MPSEEPTVARLEVLVQRLLDAELLMDAQCAAILDEASAARRLWEGGQFAEACRHVERVVLFTDALVRTGALVPADGRGVIETASVILQAQADAKSHCSPQKDSRKTL
ncbi:MAG: hypothetical protein ACAH95_17950 [Fimbriimonas sp.]